MHIIIEEQLSVTREALKEAEAAKVEAEKEAAATPARRNKLRNAKAGTGLVLIVACIGAGLLLRSEYGRPSRAGRGNEKNEAVVAGLCVLRVRFLLSFFI